MLRTAGAIVVPLLLCLACSVEPRDRRIPADASTWRTNTEFQQAIDTLERKDRELLQGWMMRHAFKAGTGEGVPKRTIAEAIEEQREFIARRRAGKALEADAAPSEGAPSSEPPAP